MSEHLLEELARRKLVRPESLVQGLQIGLPIAVSADDNIRTAGLEIAKLSAERRNLVWRCATEQTAAALNTLSDITREAGAGCHRSSEIVFF